MTDDLHAITNLVHSYAEMLDAGDIDGLAQLFARATIRTDGTSEGMEGAEFVRRMIEDAVHLYDGIPSTKHVVTNLIVDVESDGRTATARSYYTAFQARPELPLQPIIAGRWHDRFEHDDAGWYFADRVIFADLLGDLRFHIKGLRPTEAPTE